MTIKSLHKKKEEKKKIIALTAYDAFTANICDQAGVDMVLVGDSLGNVIQGKSSTVSVSIDDMIYHTRIVSAHIKKAFLAVDVPFGAVSADFSSSIKDIINLYKESGAQAVKIEGTSENHLILIRQLQDIGMPVIGHLGFLPQRVNHYGGFKISGDSSTEKLLKQASDLEKAGICLLVLECLYPETAKSITERLKIPTIGIGSGPHVDGQILVIHDLLGMGSGPYPRFVRPYGHFFDEGSAHIKQWISDIQNNNYPNQSESY